MSQVLDPQNTSHFSVVPAPAGSLDGTVAGWYLLDGRRVKPLIFKDPNTFRLQLGSELFTLHSAVFSQRYGFANVGTGSGVRYPCTLLGEYPLGKNFLGLGIALAVYQWPRTPLRSSKLQRLVMAFIAIMQLVKFDKSAPYKGGLLTFDIL